MSPLMIVHDSAHPYIEYNSKGSQPRPVEHSLFQTKRTKIYVRYLV